MIVLWCLKVNDMTGNLTKCKTFLPSLQRAGKLTVSYSLLIFYYLQLAATIQEASMDIYFFDLY